MKHKTFSIKRLLILSAIALLAAGCGGSDSSNSDSSGQGVLALRITDAPVNDADIPALKVFFKQQELLGPTGGSIRFSGAVAAECTGEISASTNKAWTVTRSWAGNGDATTQFVSGGNIWSFEEPCLQ